MKLCMDFRKYDGVVGGAEQLIVQIVRHTSSKGHPVILLAKQNRLQEVESMFRGEKNVTCLPLPVTTHAILLKNMRLDSSTIQDIAERENADLIHFPYNWSFPFKKRLPCVLTVHDVIPFTFREAMPLFCNLFVYKPAIRSACKLNHVVTTVSEFSKKDIAKRVKIPLQKIRVINNGVREPNRNVASEVVEALFRSLNLGEDFILNVGGIHERKNIVRLIRSFAKLAGEGYDGRLVITGKVTGAPYQEKMKRRCDQAIKETRMTGRVIFTGYITDDELDALFARARLLIYPSLYEGFGIPILEAMKSELPVITSKVTAMPEVAGDAALLVDPYDVKAMAHAMNLLLSDKELQSELIQKGKERVKNFSWPRSVSQYMELFESLV